LPYTAEATADEAVVGALLAGGRSRRMGQDKATSTLGGRPLGHWAAIALAAAARNRVQVGGTPLPGLEWNLLSALRPACAPAAALETALCHFPGCAVLVCPVDCPFVAPGLLRGALQRLDARHLAAIPYFGDRWHGLVGAYAPAILPPLQNWLDQGRLDLQSFLNRVPVWRIEADELRAHGDPELLLCNVNTAADLAAAQRVLERVEHC